MYTIHAALRVSFVTSTLLVGLWVLARPVPTDAAVFGMSVNSLNTNTLSPGGIVPNPALPFGGMPASGYGAVLRVAGIPVAATGGWSPQGFPLGGVPGMSSGFPFPGRTSVWGTYAGGVPVNYTPGAATSLYNNFWSEPLPIKFSNAMYNYSFNYPTHGVSPPVYNPYPVAPLTYPMAYNPYPTPVVPVIYPQQFSSYPFPMSPYFSGYGYWPR